MIRLSLRSARTQGEGRDTRAPAGRLLHLAVLLLLLMARVPDAVSNPQLWAEDGSVFFRDAWCDGAGSVAKTYAGYYHLVPRLIALAASWFPLRHAPALYVGASLAVTLAVLALVLSPRLPLPHRFLLALAVVMVPHDGEVFANLTNLQWVLIVGLTAVVLMRPGGSRWSTALDAAFVFIGGLTTAFLLFLLPPLLIGLWRRREDPPARERLLVIIVAAAAAVAFQLHATLIVSRGTKFEPVPLGYCCREIASHAVNAGRFLLARIVGGAFRGAIALVQGVPPAQIGLQPTVALSVVGAGACTLLLAQDLLRGRGHRGAQLLLLYVMAAMAFTTLCRNPFLISALLDKALLEGSDRYAFVPRVMLLWLLVLLIRRGRQGVAAVVCIAAIALTTALGFRRTAWPDLHWKWFADRIETRQVLVIPIQPSGWSVDLRCGGDDAERHPGGD